MDTSTFRLLDGFSEISLGGVGGHKGLSPHGDLGGPVNKAVGEQPHRRGSRTRSETPSP